MTNFIPIFPLGIVVYPGEALNLHIFEPRYKQLIGECHKNNKPFGIPAVIDDKICEMGTMMRLEEISMIYADGKMDIKTRGLEVFRMLETVRELPEKPYSGAIVNYPINNTSGSKALMEVLIGSVRELHRLLMIKKDFEKPDNELWSYDLAHHAGLSLLEEYELLELMNELQRQEYLKRHLKKVLPVITEMETLKNKIKLNGHFKNLGGTEL